MATVLIDTNVLVLLVVGSTAVDQIGRHKRTRVHDLDAFRLLGRTLGRFTDMGVTPHALAETSNLLRQCSEPLRTRLSLRLAQLVDQSEEHLAPARDLVRRSDYVRVGLTDAGMLDALDSGMILLTDDHDLYVASLRAGRDAINFAHLRDVAA